MRQCELEKVAKTRNNPQLTRTGEKLQCYLDGITSDMIGSIIELRKVPGSWVLNAVDSNDIECHQIKRNSYVGQIAKPKEVPAPTFEEADDEEEKE